MPSFLEAAIAAQAQAATTPSAAQLALATVDLPGVEVLRTGTWNGREYSLALLADMAEAFMTLRGRYTPPAKLGHNPEQHLLASDGLPAAGWVKDLYLIGDRLVADFACVPQKVAELIRAGGYRTRSSEIFLNATLDGEFFPAALKAVAWLGADAPAVAGLNDAIALYTDAEGREVSVVPLSEAEAVETLAGARHESLTGSHSHPHPAYGSQGSDTMHSHEHSHAGDAAHKHSHAAAADSDSSDTSESTASNSWDGPAEVKAADVSDLRAMCAIRTGDGSKKADYKLPHHDAADGHPVNKDGVAAAAAALQGARGGLTGVSAQQVKAARSHIAGHLRKLGMNVPWEKKETTVKHSLSEGFAALSDASYQEIRNRVQDALEEKYPRVYVGYDFPGYGIPPSGNAADGPSSCIEDLYPDHVIVMDQDYDALFSIPFTMAADGCVSLGEPVPVRATYEPLPAHADDEADDDQLQLSRPAGATTVTAPRGEETETMQDTEIRAILGLDEGADLKTALLSLKAQHVELADHQALRAEVAELKQENLKRAVETVVENGLKAGKIAPANETWARDYATKDLAGFELFLSSALPVVAFGTIGATPDPGEPETKVSEQTLSLAQQLGVPAEAFTEQTSLLARKRAAAAAKKTK